MRLYEAVGKYLAAERQGAPIFGLLGDANLGYMGIYKEREGGNYIASAHEGSAVSMGDGWARTTGNVGIVTVTHGPALSNTLTALTEAVKSKTPILLLTGSTPEANEHYQYIDIEGFARLAGSAFLKVRNASEVLSILDRALTRAAADQTPVVVDIPAGLLRSETHYREPKIPVNAWRERLPNSEAVVEAAQRLASAKRPLILAGRGAVEAGARDELLALSRCANAPLVTTLLAKDLFRDEPTNLGILGGLSTPPARSYLEDVDLVISFGAALNGFTTDEFELLEGRTLIQTDIKPEALSGFGPATQVILADAKSVAAAITDHIEAANLDVARADYLTEIENAPDRDSKDLYVSTTGGGFIDMREATQWLSNILPDHGRQVCDVGRFGFSTWPHITVAPARWHYIGGFGSIGLGLAAAIGASIADPNNVTALYVGDGGIMQSLAELSTAVRHRLPLVVMVLNDQCYGAEYLKLQQFEVSSDHAMMEWPSFADVAKSLGAHGIRATDTGDLDLAASMISAEQFPLLIEVMADPHQVANSPGVVRL